MIKQHVGFHTSLVLFCKLAQASRENLLERNKGRLKRDIGNKDRVCINRGNSLR